MSVKTIPRNGNRTFAVRNSAELGTWYSAQFNAMHLSGKSYAELRTMARSNEARFNKREILAIAEGLIELASEMPEDEEA